ncbi:MAG: AMP-binding protein [Clostridia bacterium]|nr:AMP-binding protein [Clostridia bacterium]
MKIRTLCDRMFTECNTNVWNEKAYSAYSFAVNEAEKNLKEHDFERVTVKSFDGLTLSGYIRKAENEKRIILAFHGYKSSCFRDFALVSEHLFQSDCTVLFIEQRAHGRSDGEFTTFGIYERHDCRTWLDYAIRNTDSKLPVYLYGMSMGAASVLMAGEKSLPSRVKGIIADSPFTSPSDIISHTLNRKIKENINKDRLKDRLDKMVMKRFGFSLYDFSVNEALKSLSRPVLLFHGTNDRLTPFSMAEEIFNNCHSEKSLVIFENSKHLHGCFDYRNKYFDSLTSFFEKYDSKNFSEEIHLHYPEKTMYQLVKEAADRLPDDIAYNFMGAETSYSEMVEKINKTSKAFLRTGIIKGDVVTICMPNTPQAVDCLYALNIIGAVASFIHPLSAEKEIAYYLNLSKSKAIVVPDLFYENVVNALSDVDHDVKIIVARIQDELPPVLSAIYTIKKGKDFLKFPDERGGVLWKDFIRNTPDNISIPPVSYDSNRTAVVLYSGGTTGVPKGICLSDLNFNALAMQARISMDCEFSRGLKNLSAMPIFHGFGLGIGIHTVLINNACCVLMPQFNTKSYVSTMLKQKPNFIAGVPTIFKMLIECKELENADLSFLKGMFVGGDAMPAQLKKDVDAFLKKHNADIQVREGYGLTECVTASCLTPKKTYREGSIGLPFPDTQYKIVSLETGKEVRAGQEGEIIISGPTIMQGYLHNEDETNAVLRQREDGRIWLHTGDLGFIDNDGYVWFRQRIKRMIITSGYNVYPSQVEKTIETHPAVDYCCVIGVKDDYKIEKIKAFVVTKEDITESETLKEEIKNHCRKQITAYAVPREIEFRKELPKTLVGKVAYRKLEEKQ